MGPDNLFTVSWDETLVSKLSPKFPIYFDHLWFYFRGFRFYLHEMFGFGFLEQPDNNGCQKFQIKSNNKSKCAISADYILIIWTCEIKV